MYSLDCSWYGEKLYNELDVFGFTALQPKEAWNVFNLNEVFEVRKKNLNFFNVYRLLQYEGVWFFKSVDF